MTGDMDEAQAAWMSPAEPASLWRRLLPVAALIGLGAVLLVTGVDGGQPEPGEGLTVRQEAEADPETTPEDLEPPTRPAEPVERLPDAEGELYVATRNALVRVDLATGERTVRELPAVADDHGWGITVAVAGDTVVLQRSNLPVQALPRDLEDEPVDLAGTGTADPHSEPTTMMMAVYPAPEDTVTVVVGGFVGATELRTFSVHDGEVRGTERLPFGATVVHVTGRSVVVAAAGEIFRYDLDAGEGERMAVGAPIAADDERVLYTRCTADLSCALLSRHFDEDTSRRLGPAPSEQVMFFPGPDPALSPDGRWLRFAPFAPEPSMQLLDLRNGETVRAPAPLQQALQHGSSRPVWTPDGAWLLQPDRTTVWAWQPGGDELVELDLGVDRIDGLAVAP